MQDNLLDAEKSSRAGLPAIPSDYRKLLKMFIDINKYIHEKTLLRDRSKGADVDRLQNEVKRGYNVAHLIKNAITDIRKRSLSDVRDEMHDVFDHLMSDDYDVLSRKYGMDDYGWFLNPTGPGQSSPIDFINFIRDVNGVNDDLRLDKAKWRKALSLNDMDLRYMVDNPDVIYGGALPPLNRWPRPDLHEDGTYYADEYKAKVIDHYRREFDSDMEKLLRLYGFGEGMAQELTPWQQEMLFGQGVLSDPIGGTSIEDWEMNPGLREFMRKFL